MSQPFHVAEGFTGVAGAFVPISKTIEGFEAILGGECDNIPESAFMLKGTIDDVMKNAHQ